MERGSRGRERAVQVLRARPTMIDVAREAGVALKTVSRVVNDEPGVRPETAERVRRAIARLRYSRNDLARRLRSHAPTATIGLVIVDVTDPWSAAIVRAAEDAVRDLGWLVLSASCDDDPARERRLVTMLVERQVDGLLVVPAGADHRHLLPEVRRGTPVVFLARPPRGIEADTVLVDERGGARAGVAALLEAGRYRIGLVGGHPAGHSVAESLAGAIEAMRVGGAPLEWLVPRLGADTQRAAADATRALLAAQPPVTALFAVGARQAAGAARALVAAGSAATLLVFGPFELAGLLPVPVTVIHHDPGDLGRRGAELLLDRLDGNAGPARHVVLPARLRRHEPLGAPARPEPAPDGR
jgi:LacI family transcriptional regulator